MVVRFLRMVGFVGTTLGFLTWSQPPPKHAPGEKNARPAANTAAPAVVDWRPTALIRSLSGKRERVSTPKSAVEEVERLWKQLESPVDMFCLADPELRIVSRHQDDVPRLAELLKQDKLSGFETYCGSKAKAKLTEVLSEEFAKMHGKEPDSERLALYQIAYQFPYTEAAFLAAHQLAQEFLMQGELRLASVYYAKAYEYRSVVQPNDHETRFFLLLKSMAIAKSLGQKERFQKLKAAAAEIATTTPPLTVLDRQFTASEILRGGEKWFAEHLPYPSSNPTPLIGQLLGSSGSDPAWYWRTVQLAGPERFSEVVENRNWLPMVCGALALVNDEQIPSGYFADLAWELGKVENQGLNAMLDASKKALLGPPPYRSGEVLLLVKWLSALGPEGGRQAARIALSLPFEESYNFQYLMTPIRTASEEVQDTIRLLAAAKFKPESSEYQKGLAAGILAQLKTPLALSIEEILKMMKSPGGDGLSTAGQLRRSLRVLGKDVAAKPLADLLLSASGEDFYLSKFRNHRDAMIDVGVPALIMKRLEGESDKAKVRALLPVLNFLETEAKGAAPELFKHVLSNQNNRDFIYTLGNIVQIKDDVASFDTLMKILRAPESPKAVPLSDDLRIRLMSLFEKMIHFHMGQLIPALDDLVKDDPLRRAAYSKLFDNYIIEDYEQQRRKLESTIQKAEKPWTAAALVRASLVTDDPNGLILGKLAKFPPEAKLAEYLEILNLFADEDFRQRYLILRRIEEMGPAAASAVGPLMNDMNRAMRQNDANDLSQTVANLDPDGKITAQELLRRVPWPKLGEQTETQMLYTGLLEAFKRYRKVDWQEKELIPQMIEILVKKDSSAEKAHFLGPVIVSLKPAPNERSLKLVETALKRSDLNDGQKSELNKLRELLRVQVQKRD